MKIRQTSLSALALSSAAALAAATPAAAAEQLPISADQAHGDGDAAIEEIVVTAQRRKENMQSVPISVSAISAGTLNRSGVAGTLAINQIVPSVQVTGSGPQMIFFIRGVGNTASNIGEEGANAFYVDGIYLGDLASANVEFNNIERVEVLKGPQGTLFGRNSSGGLINIITREPGDRTVMKASVRYANYQTFKGQLYLASPLTPNLSADIALTGRDQNDGWGTNLFNGKDAEKGWLVGARSKIVWRPGGDTKFTLSGDYRKSRDDFYSGFQLFRGEVGVGGFTSLPDYDVNSADAGFARVRNWGISLTAEQQFDWATLTSITAHRDSKVFSSLDADYTPPQNSFAQVRARTKTFQQELRLASATTNPLSWQLGAFYYRANARLLGQTVTGLALGGVGRGFVIISGMKTNSFAPFGEVTYGVTPTTHVTGGIRYTHEKRKYDGRQVPVNQVAGSPLIAAFTRPLTTDSGTFKKVTYRVAVRQDLTDKVNVYASYNRGFKSGLFVVNSTPGTNPPVKPQIIDAIEVGAKTQLFDNMLRFNIAGFHYDIKNYQVKAIPPGSVGTNLLLNAAKVKVDGAEVDIEFAPTRELRFTANAVYLNSRFANFPLNVGFVPRTALSNPATPCAPPVGPFTGGALFCGSSADGNQVPKSPKFASSVGMTYTRDVGSQGQIIASVLHSYSSKFHFEADNRLTQKAYHLVNASLEYRPTPNWGIEVYAKNIGDEHHYEAAAGSPNGGHGELAPPRTYGINLTFDF